jgi:uncharacterized protein YqeY
MRLRDELKAAMKQKDTFKLTVIRSVLAEVTNADKAGPAPIKDNGILAVIQKSISQRTESATQFRAASRTDLAEKEDAEAALLVGFLPPQLTESEVEERLRAIIKNLGEGLDKQRGVGIVMKEFYQQVDKAQVQGDMVAKKVRDLLSS